MSAGHRLTFLDRDVLLARDEPVRQLMLANIQAQHFSTFLTLQLAPGLNATILRGWMSVDATVRGRTARIIGTHLESFYQPVQEAQAVELATGPAATSLPVILAGDLNTGPGSQQTVSYDYLTQPPVCVAAKRAIDIVSRPGRSSDGVRVDFRAWLPLRPDRGLGKGVVRVRRPLWLGNCGGG